MNEVYRLSLLIGALGIALIYGSSLYIEPEKVNSTEIKPSWSGKKVLLEGNATGVSSAGKHLFFDLEGSEGEIKVAEFESDTNMSSGEKVVVEGRVTMYQGNLEVVAEEID